MAKAELTISVDLSEVRALIAEAVANAHAEEAEWRKAIADQVRANCTPPSEAYAKGGDTLIYAVCDWIESPPEWSKFNHPASQVETKTQPSLPSLEARPEGFEYIPPRKAPASYIADVTKPRRRSRDNG